ncbi:hypothetical protein SLA2020_381010 [Shorea laevis]
MHGGGFELVVGADDGKWRNFLGLTVGGTIGGVRRPSALVVGGSKRSAVGEGDFERNGFWVEMKWVALACRGS